MPERNEYRGVDAYVEGLGTVRECIGCSALIAGSPTRCLRCVYEGKPKRSYWRKLVSRITGSRDA